MKHASLPVLAALFCLAGAARAFQADFSRDDPKAVFKSPAGAWEVSDGALTLPARAETIALPVEAGKKYKLEIAAETAGDFAVETNDRALILTLQSHRSQLASTYEVVFLNAAGEEIPAFGGTGPGARTSVRGFFLTNRRHPYVAVFYTPVEAAGLKVRFQANSRSTRIATVRLAEEAGENTVNPNPDFRYGELNYAGWQPARDGRLYTRPDGKTVLNLGYGGTSPFFPLRPENKYRVSATAEGKPFNIEYFDKAGKPILKRFLIASNPKGAQTDLIPPPETAMARVSALGAIIEEFKVVQVK